MTVYAVIILAIGALIVSWSAAIRALDVGRVWRAWWFVLLGYIAGCIALLQVIGL